MPIDASFESGNIVVQSETNTEASLSIRHDTDGDGLQWFYFKDTTAAGATRSYSITNAGQASYPAGWDAYAVLATYDQVTWFRVDTAYDDGTLSWTVTAEQETVWFAFFPPYGSERRAALVQEVAAKDHVTARVLGSSLEDRALDVLVFGDESNAGSKKIWIVARQHAGEPMAEFAAEGFIRRLADDDDATVQQLLANATVYVVPNMNPDGSAAGNLRANAAGVDLNRAWHARDRNTPEITCVLYGMQQSGVDYFFDLHGDEVRNYIWFLSPGNPEHMHVQKGLEAKLASKFPEIQAPPMESLAGIVHKPGLAINHVATTFDCPAWVIELPFSVTPQGDTMQPDGCMKFGAALVDALAETVVT